MKKTLLLLVYAIVPLAVFSQRINGTVLNKKNQIIKDASIALKSVPDKRILQSSFTDSLGAFKFIAKPDIDYILVVSSIGYQSDTVSLLGKNRSDTSMIVRLKQSIQELKVVEITKKKPLIERKIDRLVYNVENSLLAENGDGIEAISKAPGIRINDLSIDIVGKNEVRVMVNEKLVQLSGADLINYLRTIPASNISKIEVITNPSARYEADGNSGIVNVVLKKNSLIGFNGIINTGVILASHYNTGLTSIINYNKGKLHFGGSISSYMAKVNSSFNEIFESKSTGYYNDGSQVSKRKGIRGDLRVDYDISDQVSMGIKYAYNTNENKILSLSEASFHRLPTQIPDSILLNQRNGNTPLNTGSIDFYVLSKLDTLGKRLEFQSSFFEHDQANDDFLKSTRFAAINRPDFEYPLTSVKLDKNIRIFSNKADLILPYKFAELELGAKISHIKSSNYLNYSNNVLFNVISSNKFTYTENTQAAYLSASKEMGKWAIKLGLRAEGSQTTGQSSLNIPASKNNYLQLFPTIYLKNTVDADHTLNLSFGRRINRPAYDILNPARIYTSGTSFEEGNPLIRPSFSNNIEAGYNYKDWLSTTIYANFVKNGFGAISLLTADNVQSLTYSNYINSTSTGISETISFNKIKWWESNNQFNVYLNQSSFHGGVSESTVKAFSAYVSTDNTFSLNKDRTLMAGAVFWYQFPEQSDILKTDAYYSLDLSLRTMFIQRKLIFSAGFTDVFRTSQRTYSGVVNGISQLSTNYRDNRNFRFMVVYRFGNSKNNSAARNFDNSEADRIRD
jgi:outer membrane receptor protein involved in Fe transport